FPAAAIEALDRPNSDINPRFFFCKTEPSFLRHSGLTQAGEVSGFEQSLDLGNIISAGPHASDAWIRALTREAASLGEFSGGTFGLALESISGSKREVNNRE